MGYNERNNLGIMLNQEGKKRWKVHLKQQWLAFWSEITIEGDTELTSSAYTPNIQVVIEQCR